LLIALPSAIASGSGNWWPVRLDWTTGVVETAGGGLNVISVPDARGGTVGHFTFILADWATNPALVQGTFTPTGPSVNFSAHEVGHCLDNVAFGGLRNLIAAVDQLVFANQATAYTELTADSHVPQIGRFQIPMWSNPE
jgi:hypothetical protein